MALDAFLSRHSDTVKSCLGVHQQDPSPLFLACQYGHTHIVEILLKHGASPNGRHDVERINRSPLMVACRLGYDKIAQLLLDRGAEPNQENAAYSTAIHIATTFNRPACIHWLAQYGADLNRPDHAGRSPIILALERPAAFEALSRYPIYWEHEDMDGQTVLFLAVKKGLLDKVVRCLGYGASMKVRDRHGRSLWDVASKPVRELLDVERERRALLKHTGEGDCQEASPSGFLI